MNLKNTILNYYQDVQLPGVSPDVVTLIIEDGNDIVGDLMISGYDHLESIEVRTKSLQNIRSLIITNNSLLKSIVFDDNACEYANRVLISSLIE